MMICQENERYSAVRSAIHLVASVVQAQTKLAFRIAPQSHLQVKRVQSLMATTTTSELLNCNAVVNLLKLKREPRWRFPLAS